MKPSRLSLAALLLAWSVPAAARPSRADDAVPRAQPLTRYEPMALRSPFTAPTAAQPIATPPPAPTGPRWWEQMFISSLMEAGGTYIVAVVDKANNKRYVLESGKPDEESHLLLGNVTWNERADQSTVVVSRGAEVAPPLRFDASATASAPTTGAPAFDSRHPGGARPNPPLPPSFTGTPPPPPPATANVVRRTAPIGSQPAAQPNPTTTNRPGQPPNVPSANGRRPLNARGQDGK